MRERLPHNVEDIGLLPFALVAVRGTDNHFGRLSFAENRPAELNILRNNATQTLDGRLVAQDLIDGGRKHFAPLLQELKLLGMAGEEKDAVGDEVGSGFMACDQEQDQIRQQFFLSQTISIEVSLDEGTYHVISGSAPAVCNKHSQIIAEAGQRLV